jgi:GT2 family glycosyltransferase
MSMATRAKRRRDTAAPDEVQTPWPIAEGNPAPAGLDHASWLADDLLVLVGWFDLDDDRLPEASLVVGDRSLPLDLRCISYARPDDPRVGHRSGKVILARLSCAKNTRGPLGRLMIRTGARTFSLGPPDLAQAVTDMRTLLRRNLAGLDPATRDAAMDLLASALTEDHERTAAVRLSKNLFTIREAIRERLPYAVTARDQPRGLHVDALMAVDERSFYIKGWIWDEEASVARLTAVSPEGSRAQLLEGAFRYPRPDILQFYGATSDDRPIKSGFISYFQVEAPSHLSTGWIVELRNAFGVAIETKAPPVVRGIVGVRDRILADLVHERQARDDLLRGHLFPAVSRLQERHCRTVHVESVDQFGTPNESADVSIIIPLYGRIDFLEHQLAQFVHDPEVRRADLIYVLDSPELADNLRDAAAQLFRLYRLPFRVATLERNVGFSGANNVGASLARGRLLLLLNSDVLPDRPDWLGLMTAFYDSTPRIGALGPKLLYEDNSLQHAGMYFSRPEGSPVWENMHYFKGLHRHLPAANVARPVPAVSGACLLIDRNLYREVGGLEGVYVQGDFEDSDLCLRLIEAGHEHWYLPHVELYHLEGQSYPLALRQLTLRYNAWLHTQRWNERIEAIMARYEPSLREP